MRKASNLALAALFGLALITGCGKKEEPPKPKQGFEDFAAKVENKSQVFESKSARKAEEKERELKIGVIAPKTGEEAGIGRMTFEGIELAAEEFNSAGGINGKPLEVVALDEAGSAEAAKAALNSLVEQNVAAIIGGPTGWSTFAPVYISSESRTVFVSAGTRRHIGTSGPFSFRVSLPIESASDELLQHAVAEGKKSFFLLTVMEDEALNVASALRRSADKAGAAVGGEGTVFSETDIPDAVSALKDSRADAVLYAGPPQVAASFLKQARKAGVSAALYGGEELYDVEFLKAGEAANGAVIYAGFFAGDSGPVTGAFVKNYRKRYGHDPTRLSAEAYDSYMLLAHAIKSAGSTRPGELRQAMMSVSGFKGVTGTMAMGKERESVRSPYILKVEKKSGKYAFSAVKSPHRD